MKRPPRGKLPRTPGGSSLLHSAARSGGADAVEAVLSHGADVNAMDEDMTALYIALRHSNEGAVKALLEHEADVDMRSGDGRAPIVRPPSPPLLARFGELVFLKFITCELTLA